MNKLTIKPIYIIVRIRFLCCFILINTYLKQHKITILTI